MRHSISASDSRVSSENAAEFVDAELLGEPVCEGRVGRGDAPHCFATFSVGRSSFARWCAGWAHTQRGPAVPGCLRSAARSVG